MNRTDSLTEFKLCANYPTAAEHAICVQGHKVKYSSRNNSAADCSISLKYHTEFDRGEAGLHVQGQSSKVKVTRSKFKVTA